MSSRSGLPIRRFVTPSVYKSTPEDFGQSRERRHERRGIPFTRSDLALRRHGPPYLRRDPLEETSEQDATIEGCGPTRKPAARSPRQTRSRNCCFGSPGARGTLAAPLDPRYSTANVATACTTVLPS